MSARLPPAILAEVTRAAMRALGIGNIVVTPTPDGWRFEGDGSLAGMVHSGSVRAPQAPRARKRPGEAVALLEVAQRPGGPRRAALTRECTADRPV